MKCGLFAALFAAFSIVLFTGFSASAASIYDDTVTTTDELFLSVDFAGGSFDPAFACEFNGGNSIAQYWSNPLTDPGYAFFNDHALSTWTPDYQALRTSLETAMHSGTIAVLQHESVSGGSSYVTYSIWWTQTPDVKLNYNTYNVYSDKADWQFILVENFNRRAGYNTPKETCNAVHMQKPVELNNGELVFYSNDKILTYTGDPNYPAGYEGDLINGVAPQPPEILSPDYSWNITTEGELSVTYLKNLDYFLTGTSYLKIDSTGENWEAPTTTLESITVMPGGSLDERYDLPGAGYYRFDITHNGQLDSPPWPENSSSKYSIKQRWVELYWNGKSPMSGTTVGCDETVCNAQRAKHGNAIVRKLEQLSINSAGIESLILAPINYIAQIPSYADNCSPITVPYIGDKNMTFDCVKPNVQANIPNILFTFTVITNGIITLFVSYKSFRLIQRLYDPEDDKIEVQKL